MPIEGIVPFEKTSISCSISGTAQIEWELSHLFTDPGPYSFTLQGASSGVDTADFINIGIPVINTWKLIDDEDRLFGKELDWVYRVKLTTALRTYYSNIIFKDSGVDYRTWRIVREIIRKEKLRMDRFVALNAVIFKRKRKGSKCTRCADYLTDEAIDGNCQVCLGTGILAGYYGADPIYIEQAASNEIEKQDIEARGTISQGLVGNCRIIGGASSQDVIWDKASGRRYIIHETSELVTVRGYNIISSVNLRSAPYTDVVYTIPEEGI